MGVFVVGMHRSGTSALTRLVAELGLYPGDPAALMTATEDNAAGYLEVSALTAMNDQLLDSLGGSALAPPILGDGDLDRLSGLAGQSTDVLESVFGASQWVWKDPRNCLLLPFWLRALDGSHLAVVIYRDPEEVAASLQKRDPMGRDAALALWEYHVRRSLKSVESMPVYLTSYEALVGDPVLLATELTGFLGRNGYQASVDEDEVDALGVQPGLRHHVHDSLGQLSGPRAELLALLSSLVGEHESFEMPELGPMDELSRVILEERNMSIGPAERERSRAEARRTELEIELASAATELDHRQSVIDGLLVEIDSRSQEVHASLAEAARWRGSVDRLGAECDKRDLRIGELEEDLEAALARIHIRATK